MVAYEGPNDGGTGPLDTYQRIADDDTAKVVSTSWGICEADNTAGAAQAEATVFAQMALQGQTLVAASGDSGSEACLPFLQVLGASAYRLAVGDPASQPYVTGVGGTGVVTVGATAGTR